jgi:alpha-tubulin suppressor-like RCC1 family protein
MAIKTDGTLWGWGTGQYGALGLGDTVEKSSAAQVGALTNWSKISMGVAAGAAIKTDGTLWTWGRGIYGGLGLGDTTNRSSPVQVGALTTWLSAVAGQYNNAAIKTDGTLWTWGSNYYGNLGLNDTTARSSPVQVGALTNWSNKALAMYNHLVSIKTDNSLWISGRNDYGQLGDGSTVNKSSPVQVGSKTNWANASVRSYHSIAIG